MVVSFAGSFSVWFEQLREPQGQNAAEIRSNGPSANPVAIWALSRRSCSTLLKPWAPGRSWRSGSRCTSRTGISGARSTRTPTTLRTSPRWTSYWSSCSAPRPLKPGKDSLKMSVVLQRFVKQRPPPATPCNAWWRFFFFFFCYGLRDVPIQLDPLPQPGAVGQLVLARA